MDLDLHPEYEVPKLMQCEDVVNAAKKGVWNRHSTDVDGVRCVGFKYRLMLPDTFTTATDLNMRGITFVEETGEIIALPFFKFFNLCEVKQEDVDIDTIVNAADSVYEKLDGSLISVFRVHGRLFCKTMGSFDNEQSVRAAELLTDQHKVFCHRLLDEQLSPTFELIGPDNQIVVPYHSNQLVFLAARSMETGQIRQPHEVDVPKCVAVPQQFHSQLDLNDYMARDDVEGVVVIQSGTRRWFKLKTEEYVRRHKNIGGITKFEQVADRIFDGTVDDLLSSLSPEERQQVEEWHGYYIDLQVRIAAVVKHCRTQKLTRKEVAMYVKSLPNAKQLMPLVMLRLFSSDKETDETAMLMRAMQHCTKSKK